MRISDWSSDVCSSDLALTLRPAMLTMHRARRRAVPERKNYARAFMIFPSEDRKSVVKGKSVSVRVDLGGRRIIKKHRKSVQPIEYSIRHHNLLSFSVCNQVKPHQF